MKHCLFYIPGFKSSVVGDKADALQALCGKLGWDFVPLNYPGSYDPVAVSVHFCDIVKNTPHLNAVFFGTSLGGFWADYLAKKFKARSVLVNPSMHPSATLVRHSPVGGLVDCYDGTVRSLTLGDCVAYYGFEDQAISNAHLILCADDEVLDYKVAACKFAGADVQVLPVGGHRANTTTILNIIVDVVSKAMNREYI